MTLLWLALAGCTTDYHLGDAPPSDDEDDEIGGGSGHDDPWGEPDPDDPWGKLDPGGLPEVYLVVAWTDYDTRADYITGDELWSQVHPTWYTVFDLRGQAILSFDTPPDRLLTHAALEPAGPGLFQATVNTWPIAEDGSVIADPAWEVWRGDGVAQTFTPVMHHDAATGVLTMPTTGVELPLGTGKLLTAASFPSDPSRTWLWASRSPCSGTTLDPLRGVSTHRAGAPVAMRQPRQVIDASTAEAGGYVSEFEAGTDTAGVDRGLIGLLRQLCYDSFDPRLTLTAFELAGESSWTHVVPLNDGTRVDHVRFSPEAGGQALWVSVDPNGVSRWNLRGPDGLRDGVLDDHLVDYRTGPVIWPDTGTFTTIAGRKDRTGDAITLYNRGKRVYELDMFKFGVEKRRLWIEDVVVLPAP